MIAHIVACSTNNVIGRQGKIPWHLPQDLKHFRQITEGNAVIMGRSTFESIGKALPRRLNVVLSKTVDKIEGVQIANSIDVALDFCKSQSKIFIIGGEQIYHQTFTIISHIFLTRIHQVIENGDTWYPPIPTNFTIVETTPQDDCTFITYKKEI
jgi:dihydrofolate reductase